MMTGVREQVYLWTEERNNIFLQNVCQLTRLKIVPKAYSEQHLARM
jgi:hypothetical protein